MAALSLVKYTGDGGTTEFSIPFGYLKKAHIHVYLDDSETTAFSVNNDTSKVVMDSAPASNVEVKVQRETPPETANRPVKWTEGAGLRKQNLNDSNLHNLYLIQELDDIQNGAAEADVESKADRDGGGNIISVGTWRTNLSVPPLSRSVNGGKSVTGGGDLSQDRTLELVGDQASPGNNQVYGTDGGGNKGWRALSPSITLTFGAGLTSGGSSGSDFLSANGTPQATAQGNASAQTSYPCVKQGKITKVVLMTSADLSGTASTTFEIFKNSTSTGVTMNATSGPKGTDVFGVDLDVNEGDIIHLKWTNLDGVYPGATLAVMIIDA